MEDYSKLSLDELFGLFKQIPDFDRYPMPEIYYKHFGVKKLQPTSVNEAATYFPPPHLPLGNGKLEIRKPLPGGVRSVPEGKPLDIEVKMVTDENDDDTKLDSPETMLNLPTTHNSSESQHELGHSSPSLSCVSDDKELSASDRDVVYSLPSQPLQNPRSSLGLSRSETQPSISFQV